MITVKMFRRDHLGRKTDRRCTFAGESEYVAKRVFRELEKGPKPKKK